MTHMSRKQKYTEEFRLQMMELHQQGNSIAKLHREYGVSEPTLYKWKEEYNPSNGFTESQKISELEQRIKRLEMENNILKKATAIFAKDSNK